MRGIDLRRVWSGELNIADRKLNGEHFNTSQSTPFWVRHRTTSELARIRARRGATMGRWKKRVTADDGTDLGYDLRADPGEERPFDGSQTGLACRQPAPPSGAASRVQLDPQQIEALKSLGYAH